MSADSVLNEVFAERQRQDAKWGEQNHPDGTGGWGTAEYEEAAKSLCAISVATNSLTYAEILDEEVAEVMACKDKAQLRAELLQVAAVAVAWVEKLDRECGK